MSKKKPKIAIQPDAKKTPKTSSNPDEFYSKYPVWQFQKCDVEHPKWSITNCDDLHTKVIDKLVSFERMKWSDIITTTSGRKSNTRNHFIEIRECCKDAQKRAGELKIFEDSMLSIALGSKLRLFGIMNDNVFSIVWYDEDHEIYPVEKRHT